MKRKQSKTSQWPDLCPVRPQIKEMGHSYLHVWGDILSQVSQRVGVPRQKRGCQERLQTLSFSWFYSPAQTNSGMWFSRKALRYSRGNRLPQAAEGWNGVKYLRAFYENGVSAWVGTAAVEWMDGWLPVRCGRRRLWFWLRLQGWSYLWSKWKLSTSAWDRFWTKWRMLHKALNLRREERAKNILQDA